jgi:hypothetical protein
MKTYPWRLVFITFLSLAACTSQKPAPQTTPTPVSLSPTQLKYVLIEKFGPVGETPGIFYCDPDEYPVAREGQELQHALQQFDTIRQDEEEFDAILQHLGLAQMETYTDEQKLLIYRQYKHLQSIQLEPDDGAYTFILKITDVQNNGYMLSGTITGSGEITVDEQVSSFNTCPICLAGDTAIDTPNGTIPVNELRVGMQVWTMVASGERVPAVIIKVAHTDVPADFRLLHLLLEDGREIYASAGHPLVDGRLLGDLSVGDRVDGSRVALLERSDYFISQTFDLLPSGASGAYWANGILLKSTLMHSSD